MHWQGLAVCALGLESSIEFQATTRKKHETYVATYKLNPSPFIGTGSRPNSKHAVPPDIGSIAIFAEKMAGLMDNPIRSSTRSSWP
jgi:hypothetical protein